ncbi:multidrug efflux SMR transporter [Ammoniphilus sp. CFH 90114]|uniref:DMT family transporter n=1 Tax=Ammoniphilus sp. CFH 90114 TaxID=2493665 RepID=UPI00100E4A1D|nr:multidrug efflux SMR transporter [Ammoniphilus sp. CFH 90114]RXT15313.1 multidrug efflux SMR transporter [Ammoniphilus sp. CFH 90114]
MEWGYLVVAGIAEVAFVTFMKLSKGFTRTPYTLLTVLAASISFYLLSLSLLSLPVGTAYAIWTGIGAAGSVIVGMILFKESKDWKRLVFLSLIAVGAIGLKLTAAA